MISAADSQRLARALADEIGATRECGTAGLLLELVRRPGAQAHRSILLGHETGWQEIVWSALVSCELVEPARVTELRSRGT